MESDGGAGEAELDGSAVLEKLDGDGKSFLAGDRPRTAEGFEGVGADNEIDVLPGWIVPGQLVGEPVGGLPLLGVVECVALAGIQRHQQVAPSQRVRYVDAVAVDRHCGAGDGFEKLVFGTADFLVNLPHPFFACLFDLFAVDADDLIVAAFE